MSSLNTLSENKNPITEATLPPIAGYVERENADGNRYYEPTPETLEKERERGAAAEIQGDTDVLLVEVLLRVTLLELGL